MWRHLSLTLALVLVDDVLGVDRQTSVGVDDDTEQAGVGLCNVLIKYIMNCHLHETKYVIFFGENHNYGDKHISEINP